MDFVIIGGATVYRNQLHMFSVIVSVYYYARRKCFAHVVLRCGKLESQEGNRRVFRAFPLYSFRCIHTYFHSMVEFAPANMVHLI